MIYVTVNSGVELLKKNQVNVVIPDDVDKKYNGALSPLKITDRRVLGYDRQLDLLDTIMYKPEDRNVLLLGKQGVGKTATVEEWQRQKIESGHPVSVIRVDIEKLGELPLNLMVSRIRSLLQDMLIVRKATAEKNPDWEPFMAIFFDEIHKLNFYGPTEAEHSASMAFNALKEELARGTFPVIGATTEKEYRDSLFKDAALDRRFSQIWLNSPQRETTIMILRRRLKEWAKERTVPRASTEILGEIVDLSNAYVRTQTQPAKSIEILNTSVGWVRKRNLDNSDIPFEITHKTLSDVFTALGIEIDTVKTQEGQQKPIRLVIPPEINKAYNNAFEEFKMGDNTLEGNESQLRTLDASMLMVENRSALLIGEAGSGKTATVEQWIYDRSWTDTPVSIIRFKIEKAGALPIRTFIARMEEIFKNLKKIEEATREANPHREFEMALFIDEIHKLNSYGDRPDEGKGSSPAMNALKEGLGRGLFPIIGATTDYEYRGNIVTDNAIDRRFGKIVMELPTLEQTFKIAKRRLKVWKEIHPYDFFPEVPDSAIHEIIKLTNSFIKNQVNPSKTIAMLDKVVGFARELHLQNPEKGLVVSHREIKDAFLAEGYTTDSTATPEHIAEVVKRRVYGQPLALRMIQDIVLNSFYIPRDFNKPLLTALFVGSTGVGKTEMAKALAEAFFGRDDAMVVINGGDYATAESAIRVQTYIGDQMSVSKEKVILIDEIEKAHPKVNDTLMRMIDEGIARDSYGFERSLNSTVVIATSNLAAEVFGQLNDSMDLAYQREPNEYNPNLYTAWWNKENEVRKAIQVGDYGANHGVRPEFLERFSLMVPFLPLALRTKAMIAHNQLVKFANTMAEGPLHINIQLPQAWDHSQWIRAMHTDRTPFGSEFDDKVSVMIVEDVINSEASSTGARAIGRYINSQVKSAVTRLLHYRITNNLPVNGVFQLETKNARFETNSGERPEIICTYKDKEAA